MAEARETARRALLPVALALALVFYTLWESSHRGIFQYARSIYPIDDADEWRYTACSRLVEHGYSLFSQVFSAQPPLLFVSLAGGLRFFGDSIAGARGVEIGFGVLSLVSASAIAWFVGGSIAGAATAVFLAVSPGFLAYSHAVEAEGPMMALATLSLAVLAGFSKSGRQFLPFLAGLALAAALLMKLFAAVVFVPALWLILFAPGRRRAKTVAALSFVVAALLPLLLDFALIHPVQQWQQVVALHEKAAKLSLPDTIPPGRLLSQFLALDVGLSVMACAGLTALLFFRRWRAFGFMTLWIGGTIVMLLLFRPLFPHHLAILLTGLATSAGVAIAATVELAESRAPLALPLTLAFAAYLLFVPRLAHADRHLLVSNQSVSTPLTRYLEQNSRPRDLVAVDDLSIADVAHRLVPPPLCDPSAVRMRSGYLTASQLITATEHYQPRIVLPSLGIYAQMPRYIAWLRQHYVARWGPERQRIYIRK